MISASSKQWAFGGFCLEEKDGGYGYEMQLLLLDTHILFAEQICCAFYQQSAD